MTISPKRVATFGALSAFALTASFAHADTYALQADDDSTFYKVDLTTGVAALLGRTPVIYSDFGVSGGKLYSAAFEFTGEGFYQIDPATGAGTLIGNTGLNNFATGSVGSQIYEVDVSQNLYSIDTATGAATLIGPTGVPQSGSLALSNGLSSLYYSQNQNLFQLNTTTGAGTLIGSIGTPNFLGITEIGGIDWGVAANGQLATFTPGGATTLGALETGITGSPYALAPLLGAGVPEPEAWSMILLGFGGLGAVLRRQGNSRRLISISSSPVPAGVVARASSPIPRRPWGGRRRSSPTGLW